MSREAGIDDLSKREMQLLLGGSTHTEGKDRESAVADEISDMVARRAEIGFTTHGHTAVDVSLYAYSRTAGALPAPGLPHGSIVNSDLGSWMKSFLRL